MSNFVEFTVEKRRSNNHTRITVGRYIIFPEFSLEKNRELKGRNRAKRWHCNQSENL